MTFKTFFCLAVPLFSTPNLFAQAGALDGDFDGDGRVTTAILSGDNKAYSLAIQPNGYIVAVGSAITSGAGSSTNYGVVRYRPDGSLDNTFSLNGKADFGIATAAADDAAAVAVLPNGKILVAGNSATATGTAFSALLLNPDGTSFDASFGNNGKLLLESVDFTFQSMAIQPDGKIVAAGYASNGQNNDFAVLRLLANGSLDNTFSGDGKVLIPIATGATDFGFAVALQPDGKILIAGSSSNTDRSIAVARLQPNGALDNTFSFDGKLTTVINGFSVATAIIIQPDGKIVITGHSAADANSSKDIVVVRYQSDGTLDTAFDTDGKRTIGLVGDDLGIDILRQSDGKLLVTGSSGDNMGMMAVRLMPNGAYDGTFGLAGFTVADFDKFATPAKTALTHNNRLVMAGYKRGLNDTYEFALAQFLLGLIVEVEDLVHPDTRLIYPNPIGTQAVFEYELPQTGEVTLALFDLQGRMLHTFVKGETQPAGRNIKTLEFPMEIPTGSYLLQLKTGTGKATVKIQKH